MSTQPKETPYIYQPFGSQDKEHWAEKRIYAVVTDSRLTKLSGLTKDEAQKVLAALSSPAEIRKGDRPERLLRPYRTEDTQFATYRDFYLCTDADALFAKLEARIAELESIATLRSAQ